MDIFIIEDEPMASKLLSKLIKDADPNMNIVGTADNVVSAVKWFQENKHPDLIFSDIELLDGQSFEIFNTIEITSPVIFTTAYHDFALKAFKVNSIDYLLKPLNKADVKRALDKYKMLQDKMSVSNNSSDILKGLIDSIKAEKKTYKSRFLVKMGDRLVSLTNEQIAYFYSEDKLVFLQTIENKKYPVDFSLDELEQTLDPTSFFRLNRQFISNINSIMSIHNYFNGKLKLTLKPAIEKEVVVSREKASLFKDWLDR
jgi:two-component system LytT family response regulator